MHQILLVLVLDLGRRVGSWIRGDLRIQVNQVKLCVLAALPGDYCDSEVLE